MGEKQTYSVVISSKFITNQECKLMFMLERYKIAFGWTLKDIKDTNHLICTRRTNLEKNVKTTCQPQRRLNPHMKEVVKNEVFKLLDIGIIYPISNSKWVSLTQVVPKKFKITIVKNENGELIPTRTLSSWGMSIDYRKLNDTIKKYHFSLIFLEQILDRVVRHLYYCFLNGYLGYY